MVSARSSQDGKHPTSQPPPHTRARHNTRTTHTHTHTHKPSVHRTAYTVTNNQTPRTHRGHAVGIENRVAVQAILCLDDTVASSNDAAPDRAVARRYKRNDDVAVVESPPGVSSTNKKNRQHTQHYQPTNQPTNRRTQHRCTHARTHTRRRRLPQSTAHQPARGHASSVTDYTDTQGITEQTHTATHQLLPTTTAVAVEATQRSQKR